MIYTKGVEHIFSGFSMSIILTIKDIENKNDLYGAKDCMKKAFRILKRTHNGDNYFSWKMKLLTNRERK